MSDAGEAVRRHRALLSRQYAEHQKRRKEVRAAAVKLRFAWIEGHEKLFKFKGMSGDSRGHVLDMISNSRIYFSSPDQFNDPLDCAPTCKLAKPLTDQFIKELLEDEARLAKEAGKTQDEIEALRQAEGVPPEEIAAAITERIRADVLRSARVFCLSASELHPLLWSHYADSHRGVCLHFRSTPGGLLGLAQAVEYRPERPSVVVPLHYNKSENDITDTMVRVKGDFWGYEHEYRIIGHQGADVDWGATMVDRKCPFPPEVLCGITLGIRTTPQDRKDLMALAAQHYPQMAVYQAEEIKDRFGIETHRIR
jgi:hypothetical protein